MSAIIRTGTGRRGTAVTLWQTVPSVRVMAATYVLPSPYHYLLVASCRAFICSAVAHNQEIIFLPYVFLPQHASSLHNSVPPFARCSLIFVLEFMSLYYEETQFMNADVKYYCFCMFASLCTRPPESLCLPVRLFLFSV
jgi:hypothetical protein